MGRTGWRDHTIRGYHMITGESSPFVCIEGSTTPQVTVSDEAVRPLQGNCVSPPFACATVCGEYGCCDDQNRRPPPHLGSCFLARGSDSRFSAGCSSTSGEISEPRRILFVPLPSNGPSRARPNSQTALKRGIAARAKRFQKAPLRCPSALSRDSCWTPPNSIPTSMKLWVWRLRTKTVHVTKGVGVARR
jgi:hypothetical protein